MTKEELKKEAIKFAVDYPTSYGKGYKHKDLRIAYLAGAEPREKRIEELERICQDLSDKFDYQVKQVMELKKENGKLEGKLADLQSEYFHNNEVNEWKSKYNAHLKEYVKLEDKIADVIKCFCCASSGDDLEMAESAREVMEVLDIPCYRHGEVKSKLTEAKELRQLLQDIIVSSGSDREELLKEAEQILKED